MDPERIGKLIQESRKRKNMTQKDLANKLHITDKAVSKWERGISVPDISLLMPISSLLDISLYDLLGGKMEEEKIPKEEVEKVVKTTIEKSTNDNKLKSRIQNIIITILSIIVILFGGFFCFAYLATQTNLINYLFDPYTRPEKIKIDDYGEYNLKITNKELLNDTGLPCDENNYNCFGQLTSKLPFAARPYANDDLDTIIFTFDVTEKEYNKSWYDNNYVKKSIVVISIKSFIIIDNLEYMRFEFKDKTYTVNKEDVIKYYKDKELTLEDLTYNEIWQKEVINKLKDNKFLKEFPITKK